MKDEEYKFYYICDTCAHEKGWTWPKGHCATMHYGTCPNCMTDKVPLSGYNDWLKPGEKDLKNWD